MKFVLQRDKTLLFLNQQKFGKDRLSIFGDIVIFPNARTSKIVFVKLSSNDIYDEKLQYLRKYSVDLHQIFVGFRVVSCLYAKKIS